MRQSAGRPLPRVKRIWRFAPELCIQILNPGRRSSTINLVREWARPSKESDHTYQTFLSVAIQSGCSWKPFRLLQPAVRSI